MKEESRKDFSNSQFYMLRCLIAMAHADGIVCRKERAYLKSLMEKQAISDEQLEIIEEDIKSPQHIGELLAHVNEPQFRAQIIHFARIMAYKDGVFDENENSLLEKLRFYTTQGIDVDGIKGQVAEALKSDILSHDIKIENNRPQKGGHIIPWFQLLDDTCNLFGTDLLSE